MRLSGRLDNLLGFALRDEVLRGSATLASKRFDLNEWRSDEGELSVIPVPANLDFGFDATVNEVLYDNLTLRNARGRLRVKDQRITLENFTFNTLGGGIRAQRLLRDQGRRQADVRRRPQDPEAGHPAGVRGVHHGEDAGPGREVREGHLLHRTQAERPLGKDMMPLFPSLKGQGGVQTSILRLQDFPPLDKVASMTKLSLLEDPGLKAVKSQFAIRDGRLQVQPFDVGIGQTSMRVSGSNGIDQSLDYDLNLQVPRSLLGNEANQAISGLVSKAAGAGVNLEGAQEIALGIKLGGKVTSPSVSTDVGSVAGSTAQSGRGGAGRRSSR